MSIPFRILSIGFLVAVPQFMCGQVSLPPGATGIYTPAKMQTFVSFCPLWRTDGGFQSTIRLTNMLAIANMDAQITLSMADGTSYPLPPLRLPASGVASVSVNEALAAAPANLLPHISSWGNASISYKYDWQGVILATMSLLDTPRSLQYIYPFVFSHSGEQSAMAGASAFNGVWWNPTPTARLFVGISNSTANSVNGTIILLDALGAVLSDQPFSVPSQGTVFANVAIPPGNRMGGLRVQYSGGMEDLLVAAGIEDDTAGFSANLPVAMPSMDSTAASQSFQFASVGMMNGVADSSMGFPAGTNFTPYAYLRNVSSSPRLIHVAVNWMNGSVPQTTDLPDATLQPGESRQVTIPSFAGITPREFNFIYTYSGGLQDILAATGSADQTGNYVFAVEPHGVGEHGGVSSIYWAYGGGFDTMYTIWNPLSVVQRAQFILIGNDGRALYSVPVLLAPRGSMMIDLYQLFAHGTMDAAGRILPHGPMQGSAVLTGPKNDTTERMTIVLAGGVYNSRTATCGNTCETCNGFTSVSSSPDPIDMAVTSSTQAQDEYTWYTGFQYSYTNSTLWSSSATNVATVQTKGQASPGKATAISAGAFTLSADFGLLPTNAGQICTQGTLPPCPTAEPVMQSCGDTYILTCTSSVTRGSSGSCTVSGVPASQVTGWKFQGGSTVVNGPAGVTTWSGTMVQSGTVTVSVTACGSPVSASASVTVNARTTGFTVSMPSATQVANGTSPLPVLTSPPTTSEGSFGYSGYQYRFQVNAAASIASGPNDGYTYVTSLGTAGSTFTYELNPGITNSSDPFYQHQFGACGIPTAAQIASAVTAHEAGAQNSHWAEGVSKFASANPGPVAEEQIGPPGTNPTTFANNLAATGGQLDSMFQAVVSAISVEPPTNLPANINYPPYRTCP